MATSPFNIGGLVNLGSAAKGIGGLIGKVVNPQIPLGPDGKPTNAFNSLASIAGPNKTPQPTPSLGTKANSPTAKITPPSNTLSPKFQAPKTTGTEAGDLAAGLISNAPLSSSSSTPSINPKTGQQLGTLADVQATGALQQQQSNYGTTPTNQASVAQNNNPGGLYGQLINQLQGSANSVNPLTAVGALGYQQAVQNLGNFNADLAKKYGDIENTPIPLEFQQGREQVLARQAAGQEQALQQAVTQAQQGIGFGQAQQGLQQSGLQSAAGLAQPVGQFGLLTNPVTGQPLNTGVFQSAVAQAQQLVNSGVPANDPSVSSLLSPFGFVGPLAFYQAMNAQSGNQGGTQGGGFNPAAQSAAANQNIAFGQQTQGQAQQVNLALNQVGTLSPLIQNFMGQVGINPTGTLYDKPINSYLSQIGNAGGMAQYNTLINELQRFSSQLIGTGALTPTGVTEATQLQNPQNLSLKQIGAYLQTLSDVGNNQLYNLQKASQAGYGGTYGYTGSQASPVTNTQAAAPTTGAPGTGITNPAGQFAAGSALNLGNWALNSIGNLGGEILGWVSKALAE